MASLEMLHIDLECGRRSSAGEEEEDGGVCFSDADEGSSDSRCYSTAHADDGSYDPSDCAVDIESDEIDDEKKMNLGEVERDCRICHLSLVSCSPDFHSGVGIELGCSCKDDLAAAHQHCAETWFKIKGNTTCEICNSIARNVVGPNDIEVARQADENSSSASNNNASFAPAPSSATLNRSCLHGHRFLNFLLACMVFAFVISWLLHFKLPS